MQVGVGVEPILQMSEQSLEILGGNLSKLWKDLEKNPGLVYVEKLRSERRWKAGRAVL